MFSPLLQKNQDYLTNKIFVGLVEDNNDNKRKGRVKIRVQGVFNDLEVAHIPWASPFRSLDGKTFSIPALGKIVNVVFPNGNLYEPQYIYCENYNINLQNKLEDLSDDEYKNFISLIFDHRTQVYSDDTALTLDYYDNAIRIKKDNIDVKLKSNKQLLNLGHSSCDQDAVLGTNFFKWMDDFMDTLLIPTTLVGNFGAPILRPLLDQKITQYQALRSTFVSNNVKIVDNGKITQDDYDTSRKNAAVKDDSTAINEVKLLETQKQQQTSPIVSTIVANDKFIELEPSKPLPEKVLEERKKDLIEVKDNEPTSDENSRNYEQDHVDDFDEDVIAEENMIKNEEINNTMNEDPYSGFWSGRQGRGSSAYTTQGDMDNNTYSSEFTSTPTTTAGYGSYYSTDSTMAGNSNSTGTLEVGGSDSQSVSGSVPSNKIILTDDLKVISNSNILTKVSMGSGTYQEPKDITVNTKSGVQTIKGSEVVTCMNEFIQDVLGPFATFLKNKYPQYYKVLTFTSATRGYVPNGGSATSQHFRGQAVDMQLVLGSGFGKKNDANLILYNLILEWYKDHPVGYDQLLFESRRKYSSCWTHLSYRRNHNRLQSLRFVNDSTYSAPMNKTGVYLVTVDSNSAKLYV